MKVLLIYVPSGRQSIDLPYGLLYIASSMIGDCHDVKIIDLCLEGMPDEDLISKIEGYGPDAIGLGAITSGYRHLKRLSYIIKSRFPAVPLMAGGVIASVSKILIEKTAIDIVVKREGEIVIKNLLNAIGHHRSLRDVKGIAYRDESGLYRENAPEAQIQSLDSLPMPAYHLIDVKRYCTKVKDYMGWFDWEGVLSRDEVEKIKSKSEYLIPFFSSRGCANRCSFCYRHMQGIRQFSPEHVISQMKYLRKNYGIGFFQFIDELTNASKSWCLRFCDLLDKEELDITYVINGARVSTMDENLLARLKKTGCIKIGFGYESGSQKILDYIGKGVSKEENYEIGRLMKKVGLYDAAQIMIGFPPETPETIDETIKFLVSLAPINPSVNFILPFPATKDWDYCLERGLIGDEEEFISGYDEAAAFRINLTSYPDSRVKKWQADILRAVRLAGARTKKDYLKYALYRLYFDFGGRKVRNSITSFTGRKRPVRRSEAGCII